MYRNERLQVIDEEPYKKGGKVRKGKKKARKSTAKARKRKATGRRRKAEAMRYLPLGGALPTTGMGSVIFGAPQAPSYFRAVAPDQQTFATLPSSLKALQEGQAKLFKELEAQKEQLRKDAKMARDMAEADGKEEVTRKYVSPMSSRKVSPVVSVPRSRGASPAVSYGDITPITSYSTAVVSSPIQTLNPLRYQYSITPPIIAPIMSQSIPITAVRVEPSWTGAMSSREAGYIGADETLPVQAPASGANMVPEDIVHDAVPDSAFVPLGASAPESIGDAIDRALQVAGPPSRSVSVAPTRQPPRSQSPRSQSVKRSVSVNLGMIPRMKRPHKGYVASYEVVGSPEYEERQETLKKKEERQRKREERERARMYIAETLDTARAKRKAEAEAKRKAEEEAQAQAQPQARKIKLPAAVLHKLRAIKKKREEEEKAS